MFLKGFIIIMSKKVVELKHPLIEHKLAYLRDKETGEIVKNILLRN